MDHLQECVANVVLPEFVRFLKQLTGMVVIAADPFDRAVMDLQCFQIHIG